MTQTLVTVDEYRAITNDTTTLATVVSARLEQAVALIDEYLERHLESATYTETLEVWYEDGIAYVYPINTPITASTLPIDYGERRLRVGSVNDPVVVSWPAVGYTLTEGAIPPSSRSRPDYATPEYTGGFTASTLPYTLKVYISLCANALNRRTAGALVGAESMSVGDVSVSYPKTTGGLDALVPGISLGLRPYKRKRVRF